MQLGLGASSGDDAGERMVVEMSPQARKSDVEANYKVVPTTTNAEPQSDGVVKEQSRCDVCPQFIKDFKAAHPYALYMLILLLVAGAAFLVFMLVRPSMVSCPTNTQFAGISPYNKGGKAAAPLRGNVACVDINVLSKRPTVTIQNNKQTAQNIYGPFEAGFDSAVPGMSCLGSSKVDGGVDTNLAEKIVGRICGNAFTGTILDDCGGHATPYHYHERLWCLTSTDAATGHAMRIGTALDGHGIYGNHTATSSAGSLIYPTDLDACGGRVGVTPDSNGASVYYYMMQSKAPFTVGCFGDKASYPVTVQQCRSLYSECGDDKTTLATDTGNVVYDLDCPCFDSSGSNVV